MGPLCTFYSNKSLAACIPPCTEMVGFKELTLYIGIAPIGAAMTVAGVCATKISADPKAGGGLSLFAVRNTADNARKNGVINALG